MRRTRWPPAWIAGVGRGDGLVAQPLTAGRASYPVADGVGRLVEVGADGAVAVAGSAGEWGLTYDVDRVGVPWG
jgi:hypothetical protein